MSAHFNPLDDVFSCNPHNLDKFFIGADRIFRTLSTANDMAAKTLPGYPPYNIVKIDDNKYAIEMAVAGFGKNNIDIEMADGVLTIKGNIQFDSDRIGPQYVHKGIAERDFVRKFSLADSVVVKNAELINGMLQVWLENIIPEEKKPKKIPIGGDFDGGSL
jgi:molecular chaperone IbpA